MAVWAEITLKPWGQHGELGTGKTRVEVDVRRREQRGARVHPGARAQGQRVGAATCWCLEVDVERGETRQRSRPGVARQHGTMGEFEAEVEVEPADDIGGD
uniref:Uncharacterized protein n=1 Tax=Oryza sativa subsp. japonica TaxID=39947 RepID=Q6YUA0_ORYSJ|nr:hypothetical protein [Oryza sativa Japonica Group]BAD38568.1 hypothetical protein [Oryza sativa Japonica Group]